MSFSLGRLVPRLLGNQSFQNTVDLRHTRCTRGVVRGRTADFEPEWGEVVRIEGRRAVQIAPETDVKLVTTTLDEKY